VTIDEYLKLCQDELSIEEYYAFEIKRVDKLAKIKSTEWIEILKEQSVKCYYCRTD